MSRLVVGQLQAADPTTNLISVASGDTVYSPGSVVQVVNTTLYAVTSVSIPNDPTASTNIPDFTCSITPKSTSSKVYVSVRWFGELSPQSANWNTTWGLKRNGSVIGRNPNASGRDGISMAALGYYADDGNSTPEMLFFDYWDTPASTSTIAYQVYAASSGTPTIYTNRTVADSGSGYEYGSSTITLWEIAQ